MKIELLPEEQHGLGYCNRTCLPSYLVNFVIFSWSNFSSSHFSIHNNAMLKENSKMVVEQMTQAIILTIARVN